MARDNGKLLNGQKYDEKDNLVWPFTQQMMTDENWNVLVGITAHDINPVDANAALVRIYTPPANILTTYISAPTVVSFQLPDVLESISVTYNASSGNGENFREIGVGVWSGESNGFSLNPTASAQASTSIMPDVSLNIRQTWSQNVPAEQFYFYIANGTSQATLLDAIGSFKALGVLVINDGIIGVASTASLHAGLSFKFSFLDASSVGVTVGTTYYVVEVLNDQAFTFTDDPNGTTPISPNSGSGTLVPIIFEWPRFKPMAHTLVVKGMQVNLSQNAESVQQYRWSPDNVSYILTPANGARSDGYSYDIGLTTKAIRIPPTIHGAITITGATATSTATVTVKADIPTVTELNGAPVFQPIINHPNPMTATASGAVSPTSFSATEGLTDIPTTGLYLMDMYVEPYKLGYSRVRAVIVDFSVFE